MEIKSHGLIETKKLNCQNKASFKLVIYQLTVINYYMKLRCDVGLSFLQLMSWTSDISQIIKTKLSVYKPTTLAWNDTLYLKTKMSEYKAKNI